jgi:hypothetical protein
MINKNRHCKAVVEWGKLDDYRHSKALSVTQLQKSVRELILSRNFKSFIVEDVMDRFWMRFGTALHKDFERVKYRSLRHEGAFRVSYNGVQIAGHYDALDLKRNFPCLDRSKPLSLVVMDVKVTSFYKVSMVDYDDWRFQLSAYKWGIAKSNPKIGKRLCDHGVVVAIMKDWTSRNQRQYPDQIAEIPIHLYSVQEMDQILKEKTDLVKPWIDTMHPGSLPICSDEYRAQYGRKKCEKYCHAKSICEHSPGRFDAAIEAMELFCQEIDPF